MKNFRNASLEALKKEALAEIAVLKLEVEAVLTNPVGIGDHPDILTGVKERLAKIAELKDRVDVIEAVF